MFQTDFSDITPTAMTPAIQPVTREPVPACYGRGVRTLRRRVRRGSLGGRRDSLVSARLLAVLSFLVAVACVLLLLNF